MVAIETNDKQPPSWIIKKCSYTSVITHAVLQTCILVYQMAMYKLTTGIFDICYSFADIDFLLILFLTPVLFLAYSNFHNPLLINKHFNP